MSARRIRIVVLGAAAVLAVLVFVLASSDSERDELEVSQEEEHREQASARPSARPSFESEGDELPPAPAPVPPAAALALSDAQARQPDPSVPLDPALRQHAQAVAIPTTAMAMERGDAKHLQQVLKFFEDHRDESVVSEADIGAIEAAIACIERAPDAQEEAAELLSFGASTALAKSLRKVCGVR